MADVADQWVPARLVPGDSPERSANGQRTVTIRAELVCAADALDLKASDEVQIRSRHFGEATWKVSAAPQQVISRRTLRAIVVPVERVTANG